jgi:hypothetical protein
MKQLSTGGSLFALLLCLFGFSASTHVRAETLVGAGATFPSHFIPGGSVLTQPHTSAISQWAATPVPWHFRTVQLISLRLIGHFLLRSLRRWDSQLFTFQPLVEQ